MNSHSGEMGYVRMKPDGDAYPNSYAPPGKTVRVALCGLCLDTGRQITDDSSLGDRCDCSYGEALVFLCKERCPSHDRTCQHGLDEHETNGHGYRLHLCPGDEPNRWAHNFYAQEKTA